MTQIDMQALEANFGGDQELLADLSTMFAQSIPDSEARIRIAIENDDAVSLALTVHLLKSRLGYLGATDLYEIASSVEQDADLVDLHVIRKRCEEMFSGIDHLLEELNELTNLSLTRGND